MKSITEATWKDAAVIEVRSLLARLEDVAGTCARHPREMLTAPVMHGTLESITRQAARLADIIDRIKEAPRARGHRGGRRRAAARARQQENR
jgi:hypothetical protein